MDWLAEWLTHRLTMRVTDCVTYRLTQWLQMADLQLTDQTIEFLTDELADCLADFAD